MRLTQDNTNQNNVTYLHQRCNIIQFLSKSSSAMHPMSVESGCIIGRFNCHLTIIIVHLLVSVNIFPCIY